MSLSDEELDQALGRGLGREAARWARSAGAPATACEALQRAVSATAEALGAGHACLPLAELPGGEEPHRLRATLLASGLVAGDNPAVVAPFALDGGDRFYLYRYLDLERRLATALRSRAGAPDTAVDAALVRPLLEQVLPADGATSGPDWQRLAVALALLRPLAVISGGPGTGKTTAVTALLACLLAQQPDLRVALAAPTGKAAARLLESLRARAAMLPPALRERLPATAYTVHRLLGSTGEPGRFRHHAGNPLGIDVLVVDEASMLDLALATRLVEALPASARLVLVGDREQLAAVEAGTVFQDVCANPALDAALCAGLATLTGVAADAIEPPPAAAAGLRNSTVWLSTGRRFSAASGVGLLAADLRAGQAVAACRRLARGEDAAVRWIQDPGLRPGAAVESVIEAGYAPLLQVLAQATTDGPALAQAAFAALDGFRVLCALREGPRGAVALNALCERMLRGRLGVAAGAPWHRGRVVMLSRNDHALALYNGDVGICLPDADGALRIWFRDAGGGLRSVTPARLPDHEGGLAITVHKAQGSEFAEVLLVMPAQPSRAATRELLYTGVTRAARGLALAATAEVIAAACAQTGGRHSGLGARLAGA